MNNLEVTVARNLLKIKAVFLRPNEPFTWASGIKSPIYCDNRLTLSYVDVRDVVENGLVHVTDKTNFQTIYTRNKIRLDVIPYIKENINQNVINTIGDNIEQYKEDGDCLMEIAESIFNEVSRRDNGKIYVNVSALKTKHIALQKRVIIKAIQGVKQVYQDIANARNIDSILELMDKENGKSFEMSGIYCYMENGYLVFAGNKDSNAIEYNIEVELPDELTDEEIQNTLKDFVPYYGCTSIEWTELED